MQKKSDQQSWVLPKDINRLLSSIALFENDFSIDWIVELTKCKTSTILSSLKELVREGWLRQKQTGFYCIPYTKKKKIVQSLSSEEQDDFHRRISEILIADQMDDNNKARTVSYHLRQIQVDVTGCCWLKKAGDFFVRTFNNEEALKCYLKIIENLPHFDGIESELLFIETALHYAKISIATEVTSNVLSVLQSALVMATRLNRPDYKALLKINIATNEYFLTRDDSAIKNFVEGRKIAETLDDCRTLNKINLYETFFYFRQGRYREVIKCYEKFVPEITKFPEGIFPLINMCLAGYSYGQTGAFTQGLGVLDAMQQHTKATENYSMEAYAVSTIGVLMLDLAKPAEALPYLENGLELATRHYNGWVKIACNLSLAFCHYLMGETRLALAYLKKFLDLSSHVQVQQWPYSYLILLCWGMENDDLPVVSDLSLREEIRKTLLAKNIFLKGIAYRYQALFDKKNGASHKKIMRSLQLSLEFLHLSGHIVEEAKTHLEMTRQYLYSNEDDLAKQMAILASQVLSPLNEALIPDDLKSLCSIEDKRQGFLLKEIFQLGQDIVNIRESRDLVRQIISSVNRLTGAERGALFLKSGEALQFKASKNITSEQISLPSFSESLQIIEEVASKGIGLIKGTNKNNEKVSIGKETIRSVICVPMMLRDEVKGVLYHDNRLLSSAFNESDLDLLAFFAAMAAFALENVTSYEEMQEAHQKLTEKKEYLEEQFLKKMSMVHIIGESPSIKLVLKQIEQVTHTDANVLITGDTGVGKELVACAIHHNSNRKDNSFICVQCSALPEKLLPSELFGYEKGAFTGAAKRKLGRFELANRGTLFLDEMGEMSLDMQVQLLRVLQTRQFERIGGSETITSDFRLIAATNRDLKKEVEAGRFRRDLYYRLNVFPIHVPSLKERKKDIPLFVEYFAKIFASQLGKSFDRISQEDIKYLLDYDWPGNVRELQNLVERAVIIHQGSTLRLSRFLPKVIQAHLDENSIEKKFSLTDNERQYIIQALQKTNWKVSGTRGAARLLDINPSTLTFRMKKLGIMRPF